MKDIDLLLFQSRVAATKQENGLDLVTKDEDSSSDAKLLRRTSQVSSDTGSSNSSPELLAASTSPLPSRCSQDVNGGTGQNGMVNLILAEAHAQAPKPTSSREITAQRAILSLLQRASTTPEELVLTGYELCELGLLSRDLLASLFASVGISADVFASVMPVKHPPHQAEESNSAVPVHSLIHSPGASKPSTALGKLLPSWLIHPAASGRSLLGTPSVGLGPFSVRSRLTNEFVLLGPLGQGGGGAVFRARNRLDGREYALKRVSFSVCPGEEAVGSAADIVLREVQALARLNHRYYNAWIETDWHSAFKFPSELSSSMAHLKPSLLLLTDHPTTESVSGSRRSCDMDSASGSLDEASSFGFEDASETSWSISGRSSGLVPSKVQRRWSYRKLLIIQMELCKPHTLRDYVDKRNASGNGCIVEHDSLALLRQIVLGLEHVHACGLVHRDLKPSNLCFSEDALKLVDFGLAKPYGEVQTETHRYANSEKSSNTRGVGTPSYAAPEQLSGGEVSAAADMFPLGLILFELFHVFGSGMERAKVFGALREQRIPTAFCARWPRLAQLLRRLLSASPKDRPVCDEVQREIDALQVLGCDARLKVSDEMTQEVSPEMSPSGKSGDSSVATAQAPLPGQKANDNIAEDAHRAADAKPWVAGLITYKGVKCTSQHEDVEELCWRDALISRQAHELQVLAAEVAHLEACCEKLRKAPSNA